MAGWIQQQRGGAAGEENRQPCQQEAGAVAELAADGVVGEADALQVQGVDEGEEQHRGERGDEEARPYHRAEPLQWNQADVCRVVGVVHAERPGRARGVQ